MEIDNIKMIKNETKCKKMIYFTMKMRYNIANLA